MGSVRTVSCSLGLQVHEPAQVLFQVAVSGLWGGQVDEKLTVRRDSEPLAVTEVVEANGSRIHVLDATPGPVTLDYRAAVTGRAEPPPVLDVDKLVYLRPSRYAESDRLVQFVAAEFGALSSPREKVEAAVEWIRSHVAYVPGSSRPSDGAIDTLLSRAGVCRDSSHLLTGFVRAMDIPARFAAVYAPGLVPMDFHAVTEVLLDGAWELFDATGMAPRSHMLRIATGRDSADVAFASVYGGQVDFTDHSVSATVDGALEWDSPTASYQLT